MFVLDLPLPIEVFVYVRLIIRILFCISAHLRASFVLTSVFKVIDVDKFKKPVTCACYNKQHACAYLQPFSCYTR